MKNEGYLAVGLLPDLPRAKKVAVLLWKSQWPPHHVAVTQKIPYDDVREGEEQKTCVGSRD